MPLTQPLDSPALLYHIFCLLVVPRMLLSAKIFLSQFGQTEWDPRTREGRLRWRGRVFNWKPQTDRFGSCLGLQLDAAAFRQGDVDRNPPQLEEERDENLKTLRIEFTRKANPLQCFNIWKHVPRRLLLLLLPQEHSLMLSFSDIVWDYLVMYTYCSSLNALHCT